jgi:cellulose biosynthesis protein BcsQ
MAKIIAIGNQKGGTGKTTVTCLAANALSRPPFNLRVFVADCDPQQSIIRRRLATGSHTCASTSHTYGNTWRLWTTVYQGNFPVYGFFTDFPRRVFFL